MLFCFVVRAIKIELNIENTVVVETYLNSDLPINLSMLFAAVIVLCFVIDVYN